MIGMDLNGTWTMRRVNSGAEYASEVPGGVAATLLKCGGMEDPYVRDNESRVQAVFEEDYEFFRTFAVSNELLSHDRVLLRCEGLDTIAAVSVNGRTIAETDNMHRTYLLDVKDALVAGENSITIRFSSPLKYLEEHPSKTGRKFSVIRKAACMFGWDWGLSLPDMGIWRDISIAPFDCAKFDRIVLKQTHGEAGVRLDIGVHADVWGEGVVTRVELLSPDGETVFTHTQQSAKAAALRANVTNPRLWWPIGYGDQPLYTLRVSLEKDGRVLDERVQQIGLRTIALNRDKQPDGSNYGFIVNGKAVFFRGENLVIEDAILANTTNARWERLLQNCVRSNLNGIRVWGGAYYPPDYFYEMCDRLGLLVWQDLMFACTFYLPTKEFLETVRHELADNLSRIAHHACLALICGNNESESIYTVMCSKEPETVALRKLFGSEKRADFLTRTLVWHIYRKLFLQVIPPIVRTHAPQTSYAHSSPSTRRPRSAKSFFDYLTDGDMHYYLQYNGNAPYQKMRTMRCRFMTEMGFQSYPSMKTIEVFARAEEQTPYSDVMYAHQKCANGNEAIELYLERDYIVPKDFSDYVYLSQLQAGEIMRYSVEHLRRQSGFCNGVILWQLNDCWPVVSWSGVDYYGRWKAQQYYTKRFFAPVLVSALDEGAAVGFWVTNNTPVGFSGTLHWRLADNAGNTWDEGGKEVAVAAGESRECARVDYSVRLAGGLERTLHVEYVLTDSDANLTGSGTVLFCLAKEFAFERPAITPRVERISGGYRVRLRASRFAKGVALDTEAGDCLFSDNYFDLEANEERMVTAADADIDGIDSVEELAEALRINCLNDVMLRARTDA